MTDEMPQGALVGIPEIADIAGVQRSAVSNWRKRHADFPAPSIETPSGLLFELALVELWLFEHGKVSAPISAASLFWRWVEATRIPPEPLRDFLVSALVYLEACDRGRSQPRRLRVDDARQWSSISELPDDEAPMALRQALEAIEQNNDQLSGLLVHGFEVPGGPTRERQLELMGFLDLACRDRETHKFELFEEIIARTHERSRFSEEFATPDSLELLFARLVGDSQSIFDPACGEGGVLLLAAVIDREPGDELPQITGWDLDADTLRIARSRFFVYDVEAELRCVDSLTVAPNELPRVDAVVLDPPYGLKQWGDPDTYRDPQRWPFGTPSPKSANLAWVQLTIGALKQGGRGFVLVPAAELSKGGRERSIRQSMLEAGAIEAVVLLPGRLRRDTSIPLALLCVRSPGEESANHSVLLVDASRLGTAGRSTVALEEEEIDLLVGLLDTWFTSTTIPTDRDEVAAVVVQVASIEDADLRAVRYLRERRADRKHLLAERTKLVRELRSTSTSLAAELREIVE